MTEDNSQIHLIQTDGALGPRFAGPDLLDYRMIFKVLDGPYTGERLFINSFYHPCCGTLEVRASFFSVYKRWHNKLDGCPQHRCEAEGDRVIRDLVRSLWIALGQSED